MAGARSTGVERALADLAVAAAEHGERRTAALAVAVAELERVSRCELGEVSGDAPVLLLRRLARAHRRALLQPDAVDVTAVRVLTVALADQSDDCAEVVLEGAGPVGRPVAGSIVAPVRGQEGPAQAALAALAS